MFMYRFKKVQVKITLFWHLISRYQWNHKVSLVPVLVFVYKARGNPTRRYDKTSRGRKSTPHKSSHYKAE